MRDHVRCMPRWTGPVASMRGLESIATRAGRRGRSGCSSLIRQPVLRLGSETGRSRLDGLLALTATSRPWPSLCERPLKTVCSQSTFAAECRLLSTPVDHSSLELSAAPHWTRPLIHRTVEPRRGGLPVTAPKSADRALPIRCCPAWGAVGMTAVQSISHAVPTSQVPRTVPRAFDGDRPTMPFAILM